MKQYRRALAALIILCLLAGCGTQSAETEQPTTAEETTVPTQPQEEQAKSGFGLSYVAKYGFNPYKCTCLTNRPVISLAYEGLFVLNSQYEPEPVLCDNFQVSDNEQTYTITLCSDAAFSDGSPVTAADVAASLDAAKGSDYYGSRFNQVGSFTATDERTVTVALATPYENFLALLDVPIVKADTVDEEIPIGSGAYTIRSKGAPRLLRNKDWWQNTTPAVDYPSITLTAAQTPTDVRDDFEFGTTSLVCTDLNSPSAIGYRCDFELWDCPTTVMQYIGFNLGAGLFSNGTLRKAVTHVLDRSAIVSEIYKGFAQPACLPCPPSSRLYDQSLADNYDYSTDEFSQGLRDASMTYGGKGTILVCSIDASRVELAHYIADALAKYKLDMEVRAVDSDTYRSYINKGMYDMFIGEVRLSGNFDLSEFFKNGGSVCYGAIRDEDTYRLCKKALENSGNCYDLYKKIMDYGYFCPVLFKSYAVMATRGVISSLQPAVDSVFHQSGGRTLADASVTPEETTAETSEPEETTAEPVG